ncbi:hypothetical protein AB1Y20_001966 [Prymnesium parvum]|uniref:Protein xylosyltransferase n=1 Tax=Prymnesium parvum TaxID=97485 RepID=A0AB34J914_PRYPA
MRPVLLVHVSGSGGTSLCKQARQQPGAPGQKVGSDINCQLPCKNPYDYQLYGLTAPSKWGLKCLRKENGIMAANCSGLEQIMRSWGYHVLGAAETLLDEANTASELQSRVTSLAQMGARPRSCGADRCCLCTNISLFGGCNRMPVASQRQPDGAYGTWCPMNLPNRMLALRPGAPPSPLESRWPLSDWAPLTTYCANIRYVFLMNEPIKRLTTQLLYRCPWVHHKDTHLNLTCIPWGAHVLRSIYRHDLVVDNSNSLFSGTAAASNLYIRSVLGPRAYFGRLHALTSEHLAGAQSLLSKYEIVAPTHSISKLGPLLRDKLSWRHWTMPDAPAYLDPFMQKVHRLIAPHRHLLVDSVKFELQRHNSLDIQLYQWVRLRFERMLAETADSSSRGT